MYPCSGGLRVCNRLPDHSPAQFVDHQCILVGDRGAVFWHICSVWLPCMAMHGQVPGQRYICTSTDLLCTTLAELLLVVCTFGLVYSTPPMLMLNDCSPVMDCGKIACMHGCTTKAHQACSWHIDAAITKNGSQFATSTWRSRSTQAT